MAAIITLDDVSVTFHEAGRAIEAVRHVSLEVEQGEIFGIVGFSGAGKSTLVRTINLLERPTSGSVVIDGCKMEELSQKALREKRRDITMIFQGFNLLMQKNCLKNICFPLELAGKQTAVRPGAADGTVRNGHKVRACVLQDLHALQKGLDVVICRRVQFNSQKALPGGQFFCDGIRAGGFFRVFRNRDGSQTD